MLGFWVMYEFTRYLLGSFPCSIVDGEAINETWLPWIPSKQSPGKVWPKKQSRSKGKFVR